MVYENVIHHHAADPSYGNETWRSKHGYKELETHDPPLRRNRDFKPVGYGTFRGMPNYKHGEAFALLKNVKDLLHEEHNHPIKWAKKILFGAIAGGILGYSWFLFKPVQGFV